MADEAAKSSIDGFFMRCGLTTQDQDDCYGFIKRLYSKEEIVAASCQGFCSMTLLVGTRIVVQFRPESYRLDLRITAAAPEIYGKLAPQTSFIGIVPSSGLLAYTMSRIEGVPFKDFRRSSVFLQRPTYYQAILCKDLAKFLSAAWHNRRGHFIELGLVGKSIRPRLEALCSDLPYRFRARAHHILKNIHRIEGLPWVLTHGDIVSGNIMVDVFTGKLTGLVDWAEAEPRLPFGICLYGLEEILGEMTVNGFQYYPDGAQLRNHFWAELADNIPDLRQSYMLESVKLARDLGVLLWHGIAFDDGAINRVVQEGRDIEEIHRLDAFLDLSEYQSLDLACKI